MARDEPLLELETDKVTVEVPAPAAGAIESIAVKAGATVQVGAILGGYVIGIAEAFAGLYIGTLYADFAVFAIFLVVLLLRPQGIFGHRALRLV